MQRVLNSNGRHYHHPPPPLQPHRPNLPPLAFVRLQATHRPTWLKYNCLLSVFMCVSVSVHFCACVCVSVYSCVCLCIVCAFMCLSVCLCMTLCIYVCVHVPSSNMEAWNLPVRSRTLQVDSSNVSAWTTQLGPFEWIRPTDHTMV